MAGKEDANSLWRDAMVAHMVAMLRLQATVAKSILSILDVTEAELRNRIEKALKDVVDPAGVDIGSGRAAQRLQALADAISELRGAATEEGLKLTIQKLRDQAKAEPVLLASALERVVPVVFDSVLPDLSTLKVLATDTPFEGRILKDWFDELERADADRIMNEIRIGLVQGQGVDDIVRRVVGSTSFDGSDGATAVTRRAAEAVVRTAAAAVSEAARAEFFDANSDVFTEEAWVATLDHATCQVCAALDGKRFELGKGPKAPIHWRCRCLRVAVIGDELIGKRPFNPTTEGTLLDEFTSSEGLDSVSSRDDLPHGTKGAFDDFARKRARELIGTVPATTTFQQFLSRQSAAVQDDILGNAKGALFRRGGLKLDQFVDFKKQQEFTLKQLVLRNRAAFVKAGLDPEDFLD